MTSITRLFEELARRPAGVEGRPAARLDESGISRRNFMRQGGALGLSLPLLGGLAPAVGIGWSPASAQASVAGQCVLGVTQEAVNFNPLLYVNTGVETSVEFIVFAGYATSGPSLQWVGSQMP